MAREDLLGGGLDTLAAQGQLRHVARDMLVPAPWQPRRHFDRAALLALAHSVRSQGVRQNLIVRPHPQERGRYEIVAGERRWRASSPTLPQDLGLSETEAAALSGRAPPTLPCLVLPLSDPEARQLSAVENLQREDLDPLDEAAYRLLLLQDVLGLPGAPLTELAQGAARRLHALRNHPHEFADERAAVERLFAELGTTTWESFVSNQLPLLQLPEPLMAEVRAGTVAGRSALLIARQGDPGLRRDLLAMARAGASLRELNSRIAQAQGHAWKSLAADVRGRLGVRRLEALPTGKRARVMRLLQQLQQELAEPSAPADRNR